MKFYKDTKDITTAYDDAIKRRNIEDLIMTHSIITDPKAALGNLPSIKYTLLWNLSPQKCKLNEFFGIIYVFISYNPEIFLKLLQHLETYTELEF